MQAAVQAAAQAALSLDGENMEKLTPKRKVRRKVLSRAERSASSPALRATRAIFCVVTSVGHGVSDGTPSGDRISISVASSASIGHFTVQKWSILSAFWLHAQLNQSPKLTSFW